MVGKIQDFLIMKVHLYQRASTVKLRLKNDDFLTRNVVTFLGKKNKFHQHKKTRNAYGEER